MKRKVIETPVVALTLLLLAAALPVAAQVPHFDQVERAHAELKAEGKIARRADERQVEEDKGLVTRRAAYYLHQIDPSFGILEKTYGNNARGYSVDIIIHRDGRFWDVVTDRDYEVVPVNGGAKVDTELLPRWRVPTRELADLSASSGGHSEPDGTNNGSNDTVVALLGEFQQETNERLDRIEQTMATKQQVADHDQKVDDFREEARGWVRALKDWKTWLFSGGLTAAIEIIRAMGETGNAGQ